MNLVLTNSTAIQASPSKGKKIVESSSSTNNSEKFTNVLKDEKTISSIQNDEVWTSNKYKAEGQGEENSYGLPLRNFVVKKVGVRREGVRRMGVKRGEVRRMIVKRVGAKSESEGWECLE